MCRYLGVMNYVLASPHGAQFIELLTYLNGAYISCPLIHMLA